MLKRFNVLNSENDQGIDGIDYPILLNIDQIASIKQINIMFKGNIIQGHWIRLVSGKKYKATRIPKDIKLMLESEDHLSEIEINGTKFDSEDDYQSEIIFQ